MEEEKRVERWERDGGKEESREVEEGWRKRREWRDGGRDGGREESREVGEGWRKRRE